MDLKKKITTLLNEAELYKKQWLLDESREKYESVADLIKNAKIKNRESLLASIDKKIKKLDDLLEKRNVDTSDTEMSEKAQNLIKNLFAFSKDMDEDTAALEGAIALAKFGQHEKALEEFNHLLEKESIRVVVAKNILRCQLAIATPETAVKEYTKWSSSDLFSPQQLKKIRFFLNATLEKQGVELEIPEADEVPEAESAAEADFDIQDEDLIDISSIGINFETGPQKGREVEFDVSFQNGNLLSIIIPKKDKEIFETLEVGYKFNKINFFSPIAMFDGLGVIASKTEIKSGPKEGDFSLDLRVAGS